MRWPIAFFTFWYDFIVGDDWRVAVGVISALAITYALSRTMLPAWWVLPTALALLLPLSLWRTVRRPHSAASPRDTP